MMKRFSKVIMFVVLAAVFAGIFMIVATVPQMIVEVWKYMGIDLGYKWVINMAMGFLAAIGVNVICKKAGWGKVATIVLAIVVMIVVIVTFECVIWHPKEFGGMIASKMSPQKLSICYLVFWPQAFRTLLSKCPIKNQGNPETAHHPQAQGETMTGGIKDM